MKVSVKLASVLLLASCVFATSACYYGHLVVGQSKLLWARRPIDDVLEDPKTPDDIRHSLGLVQRVRSFASELGLEVSGQYTSYVAWSGDRIITSLVVTEPGSVEARPFHFPIVGSAPYKGFFDRDRAEAEAQGLRAEGLDVCVLAIPAYSTLGWFDDPVTTPMLQSGDGRLVETLVHELVHATVFLESEPDFNEGVASFIGQEASIRFYRNYEHEPDRAELRQSEVTDSRRLGELLIEIREDIRALYEQGVAREERESRRDALESSARQRISELDLRSYNAPAISGSIRLNDACLVLRGTYGGDLPRYQKVLGSLGGDLPSFIEHLKEVSKSADPRADFFRENAVSEP